MKNNRSIIERLTSHLQNIREEVNTKLELNKILDYAKNVFKNNDSSGWGDQVPKALKLLELVATEDLKAKLENRLFNPNNIKIDIDKITPDPITYAKDRGFWDGGDDEDYAHCCIYFDGDGDVIEVSKKFLSKEARRFIKNIAEKTMSPYFEKIDKAYKQGAFNKFKKLNKSTLNARFKKSQDEYMKKYKEITDGLAKQGIYPNTPESNKELLDPIFNKRAKEKFVKQFAADIEKEKGRK